ncbi:MAG: carboxylesterase/lipase family protein [Microthrixaceae bacterium]
MNDQTDRQDPPNGPADDTEVVVTAPAGAMRGRWGGGVARFAGVPYAMAPVGQRRFRSPQAMPPLGQEHDARHFGTVCPQNPSLMDALFGGEAETWDEDCLHLNVWSPTPEPGADLPVMVWIHGGGFEMGSGSSPLYHGESFAREDVVFVSINYRLGSIGFLELGGLDPELAGSGNAGLLDQVEALRWVRTNIAAFGGDPDNVTVFGESAGAMSVSLLLTMPSAKGLFAKAIAQSGAAGSARTIEHARADATEFLARLDVSTVEQLQALPVEKLLGAHSALSASRMADPDEVIARSGNPLAFLPFRPVADGADVPTDPLGSLAEGSAAGIPVVLGTNLDEWKLFAMMGPVADSRDAVLKRLGLLTTDAEGALVIYEKAHPGASPADLESAILTDRVFRIPACEMADAQQAHAPVWQYRFDWASPALGGLLGAAHAIEIPFVFDMVEDHRLHVLVGAEAPVELARSMHGAWIDFARNGRPSVPQLDWSDRGELRTVLILGDDVTTEDDPQGDTRRFWSQAG